jgi:hypothetical protein
VRRTFQTADEAKSWEEKVIRRLNIVKNEMWLNRQNAGKTFRNDIHSEETKKKISTSLKRKTCSK